MDSKDYFDCIAGQWDSLRETFYSESVREKAFDLAGVQPGTLAVDIGCGTGFIAEGLLARGVQVIAIDRSEAMLVEMKEKLAGKTTVEFYVAEAEDLPLPTESVDAVFANMLLHHIEEPLRVIAEMSRLLKPGGIIVITDLDEHDSESLKEKHHDRWMGFNRTLIYNWLEQSNLRDIRVEATGDSCCAESRCGAEPGGIGIFIAAGKKPC